MSSTRQRLGIARKRLPVKPNKPNSRRLQSYPDRERNLACPLLSALAVPIASSPISTNCLDYRAIANGTNEGMCRARTAPNLNHPSNPPVDFLITATCNSQHATVLPGPHMHTSCNGGALHLQREPRQAALSGAGEKQPCQSSRFHTRPMHHHS